MNPFTDAECMATGCKEIVLLSIWESNYSEAAPFLKERGDSSNFEVHEP